MIGPQGISCNVLNNYLLTSTRGCGTKTCQWPIRRPIECINIGYWKTWCATTSQVIAVQQCDRRETAADLFLYQAAQSLKYLTKGISFRNHLEDSLFPGEQAFCTLAVVNISQNPIPFKDLPVLVAQRL